MWTQSLFALAVLSSPLHAAPSSDSWLPCPLLDNGQPGVIDDAGSCPPGKTTAWTTNVAVTGCDQLQFGGHDDWRVPTKKELQEKLSPKDASASMLPAGRYFAILLTGRTLWYSDHVSLREGPEPTPAGTHLLCVRSLGIDLSSALLRDQSASIDIETVDDDDDDLFQGVEPIPPFPRHPVGTTPNERR